MNSPIARGGGRDAGVQLMYMVPNPAAGGGGRDPGGNDGGEQNPVVYLVALGGSTGPVLRVVGDPSGTAADLTGGVALEPMEMTQDLRRALGREMERLGEGAVASAYCLDLRLPPPEAGQLFRIAAPEVQRQFDGVERIVQAARRLEAAGVLRGTEAYVHSTRQWAIWARQEELDYEAFSREFLDLAKRNFEANGQAWTQAAETRVRQVLPDRWRDVQAVLGGVAP